MSVKQVKKSAAPSEERAPKDSTEGLTPKQLKAVQGLSVGHTATDVAKAVGVHRATIHRRLEDLRFRAALNRAESDLQEALQARSLKLAETAMQIVEDELDGDSLDSKRKVETALKILRGSGYLSGKAPAIGPTSPDELETADRLAAVKGKVTSDMVDAVELVRDLEDKEDVRRLVQQMSEDSDNGKRFSQVGKLLAQWLRESSDSTRPSQANQTERY